MDSLKRRDFFKKASIGTSSLLLGCQAEPSGEAPAIHTRKKYKWKMVTTWLPHFPILGEGADNIAKWIEDMSGGQLQIQVYGGGELVPALEAFDAVTMGVAEMGHGASYYWAGKAPVLQLFASVPFGMNAQQMNAWLYKGGGLELWEKVYSDFNLVPLPVGNTGVQVGGWFNKEINSVSDLQGLKMRIPGLGGKVIAKAGGSAILSAGGEIYTNLERGVIDATEWIGPFHDYLMGFHRIAKYCYYPGWHEPGTTIEMFVNKGAYEKLPAELQHIIQAAAAKSNLWVLSEFESKNREYLQKLRAESHVKFIKFPHDVLLAFKNYSKQVLEELVEKDALTRSVFDSFDTFHKSISEWSTLSEQAYYLDVSS